MAAPGSDAADVDATVDFGWEEADGSKSGRRRKLQRKFKPGTFETMGLSDAVLKGVRRAGYRLPTPIQRKAIPPILQGLDVVGMARTGSGKTAAFVLPLLQKLAAHSPKAPPRALLLSPTRELALQTARVVRDLGRATDLRVATLVGGDSLEAQFAELAAHPDVLVATPGRLLHHLDEIATLSLQGVCYAVFDEADRLFEMGFADQLRDILSRLAGSRQTLLFSATMPAALAAFASAGLKAPELVRLDAESRLSPDLGLAFFTVRPEERAAALLFVLKYVLAPDAPTVVFAATKHAVELLVALLRAEGIRALGVHGGLDQTGRTSALARFRSGRCPVLVVTDVAARGLDIPTLDNVVNYDFPAKPKLFVHRAGRA
ncbi:DEAD/DEAH box helicase, partial [Helicosporidium sp. ATCC 50920]